MGCLLTHIFIAWSIFEIAKEKLDIEKYRSLFLLGSIIPDITNLVFYTDVAVLKYLFTPLESIIGLVAFSGILTVFLIRKEENFRLPFVIIASATIIHQIIDLFYIEIGGHDLLLFPFSLERFGINLFEYSSTAVLATSLILALILTVFLRDFKVLKKLEKIGR